MCRHPGEGDRETVSDLIHWLNPAAATVCPDDKEELETWNRASSLVLPQMKCVGSDQSHQKSPPRGSVCRPHEEPQRLSLHSSRARYLQEFSDLY